LGIAAHKNRFTGEGAVIGFQGAGLVGKGLPVEGGSPGNGEDIAGEDAGGIQGLAELPVGDGSGTAKGVEKGLGAFRRMVAAGLDPGFRPADVIIAGGGFDGKCGDALDEFPAGGRRGCSSYGAMRMCGWLKKRYCHS
jgi:hypothetical protein